MPSRLPFFLGLLSLLSHFFPSGYVGFSARRVFTASPEVPSTRSPHLLGEGGHQTDPFPETGQSSAWPIGDAEGSEGASGERQLSFRIRSLECRF